MFKVIILKIKKKQARLIDPLYLLTKIIMLVTMSGLEDV